MKKVAVVFLLFFLSFVPVFSQEQNMEEETMPNIVMRTIGFTPYPFQLADNTPLDYKSVLNLVSVIPKNNAFIKQAKIWRVVSIAIAGLSLASCGFQVYALASEDASDISRLYRDMGGFITLTLFMGSAAAGSQFHDRLQRAVNNYNLSLLGIPIGGKR